MAVLREAGSGAACVGRGVARRAGGASPSWSLSVVGLTSPSARGAASRPRGAAVPCSGVGPGHPAPCRAGGGRAERRLWPSGRGAHLPVGTRLNGNSCERHPWARLCPAAPRAPGVPVCERPSPGGLFLRLPCRCLRASERSLATLSSFLKQQQTRSVASTELLFFQCCLFFSFCRCGVIR